MPTFTQCSNVDARAEQLFAWHSRSGSVARLIAPWERIEILESAAGMEEGARSVLRVCNGPATWRWVTERRDLRHGREFTERQVEGVFKRWRHRHQFSDNGDGTSSMTDEIDYALPAELLSSVLSATLIDKRIAKTMAFRRDRTRDDLERHGRVVAPRPQRIAVTGANGIVGRELCAFLDAGGHDIVRVTRRPRVGSSDIGWDPSAERLDAAGLEGLDAVVHLAGAGVRRGRWSPRRKRAIQDARVKPTLLLARTLAGLDRPPRTLISASATAYYGNRGRDRLDEEAEHGAGFTADVCRAWENSTEAASRAGVRVVNLRIGTVLSAPGGALARMSPLFRMGAGGSVGSGQQYMSWITLDDLVGLIHHALFDGSMRGPLNAVSPKPVTNREFARTLARVLKRPAVMSVPSHIVRFLFGEMGEASMLAGSRVIPAKAEANGFRFLHPDLEGAIRFELGR